MALRAKNMGYRIMIDFHYSDTWADPGDQNKPAAWASYTMAQLVQAVHDHTVDVLSALSAAGVHPEWVQVGNETNDGMLWPVNTGDPGGRVSVNGFPAFAQLINSGYAAVKSVEPAATVVIHISNGYDNTLFRWMFDGLKGAGTNWDAIGMSLYPSTTNWSTLDAQCLTNMNDMITRYGKPVVISEVGMDVTDPTNSFAFLSDIIAKNSSLPGGNGLGVFYWEPEAYNWMGYGLVAFDTTGKPTHAMDAFGNGCALPTPTKTAVPPTATSTVSNTPTVTRTNTLVPPTNTATTTSTMTFTATTTHTAVPPTSTVTYTVTMTHTNSPVPPTATSTSTASSTPTRTNTAVPPTATNTQVPPTSTSTPTRTNTAVPPTSTHTSIPPTFTSTPVPPTSTNTAVPSTSTNTPVPPTATNTVIPPTATATNTSVLPTVTSTPVPPTPTTTNTSVPPTSTQTQTPVPPTLTHTAIPQTSTTTNTPVPPPMTFTPVPPTATFTLILSTATTTNTPVPSTSTQTQTPVPPTLTHTLVIPTATSTNLPFSSTPTVTSMVTETRTSTLVPLTATVTKTNSPIPPTATYTPTSTFSFTATRTWTNTETPTATWTFTPVATTTSSPSSQQGKVGIYPNPATGPTLQVLPPSYLGAKDVRVELFTTNFRKVQDETYPSLPAGTAVTVSLTGKAGNPLANGVYYVVVTVNGQRTIGKLLVLR